jgi:leucyl/phenylalanyl-tRNA--protein transferase
VSDASKIAMAYLVFFLRAHGVKMIDCQQETAHLASLGARPITRKKFIQWISHATSQSDILEWKPMNIFNCETTQASTPITD